MMKTKYLSVLLALVCLLTGCAKNEFEIEVTLPAKVTRTYSVMYYASDRKKGWLTETVLNVTSGQGKLQGITRNPTLVWLNYGNNGGELAIWAERGDHITVTGDDSDPLTWTISGNDVNESWSKWRKDNIAALRSRDAKKVNTAVARYVDGNADTQLAALLMLTTYVRREDEAGFTRLWNKIPAKIKSVELLTAVGRADLLTAAPIDPPVKVGPFKLHCLGDTMLTVRPADADVSLIYFWTGDENGRGRDIDSVKKIVREDHDGRLLDVTDVALTQDSMSWINKTRTDSVGNLKWRRGWAPGGRMNKVLLPFALPSSPWFVVLDAKGNQIYSGAEAGEALKVARRQLRTAPARKKAPADSVKTVAADTAKNNRK